jgi:riboflavin-specific deaminase-like protein
MVVTRLFPRPEIDLDPVVLYGNEDRTLRAGRPYVMVNMVSSIDGSTALGGVTKALGSATDRAIFLHLRDVADAILVGASTVRAERYGPARPTRDVQSDRLARGQSPTPPIVVVSRSINFDWQTPFFTESDPPPILLVPGNADVTKLGRAAQSANVITCGDTEVHLPDALSELHRRGVNILLCEGGPTLNTQLLQANLIDELCLTVAPLLVGGSQPRGIFAAGPPETVLSLPLSHVLEEDGFLYLRYGPNRPEPSA